MKKYFLGVLCGLLLFTLTGCGSKKEVTCTGSFSESGINMDAKVTAELDDADKIVDATIVYDLKDSSTANQYCSLFKLMEDTEKGVTVSCSGSKITITGYAKAIENSDEEDDEDQSLVGSPKEEFIKAMEKEQFSCK